MIGRFIIFLVNLWLRTVNLWRRVRNQRIDYVRLRLSGTIAEFSDAPPRWQRRFLGTLTPLSVAELRRLFRIIAEAPQIRGVLLEIDGLASGWATLQSMRAAIGDLRAQGKQVVVYLITPDVASTYVACAATKILLPPTMFWNVLGLRAEVQFLRDALAKWGIEVEATAVSPYKSAPDTFVRTDFTPESREQFERLLDLRYAELLRALADGRGKSIEQISTLIDHAPLSAQTALDAGLVDGLCYEDELAAYLKDGELDPIILELEPALKALQRPLLLFRKQRIGLVRIEGTIMRGASRRSPLPLPLVGGTMAGAESVAQAMRQAEQNPRIAAVVVYVDSGGGEVFASDLMWREVLRVRRQKPVVVVMGNAAASGGYYLATHASAILAQPATLTGSIGVFVLRPVVAGLLEHADIHTTTISRGANSGLLGGTQMPTESERAATRDLVFALYGDFTARVCEGRTLTQEQLAPIAGGRVWLGEEALQYGLVDRIGGIPEALLLAQELAKLPQDPYAPLVQLRGGRSNLAPAAFPIDTPQELAKMVADLLRPTAWAHVPFELL